MLRLFSKVKRDLLKRGKVRSFLLYTAGELFLIVFGILIALEIEGFVQSRSDNASEQKLLLDLREDLQADTLTLTRLVNNNNLKRRFADSLFKVINETPVDVSLLLLCFSKTLVHNFFYPNTTNFDRSITDGSINLLKSEEVRNELFRYYRETNSNHSDKVSQSVYENIFTPYTIEHILPTNEFATVLNIDSDFGSIDIAQVKKDKKFNSAMMIRMADIAFQNRNWNQHRHHATLILESIDIELRRFK